MKQPSHPGHLGPTADAPEACIPDLLAHANPGSLGTLRKRQYHGRSRVNKVGIMKVHPWLWKHHGYRDSWGLKK